MNEECHLACFVPVGSHLQQQSPINLGLDLLFQTRQKKEMKNVELRNNNVFTCRNDLLVLPSTQLYLPPNCAH